MGGLRAEQRASPASSSSILAVQSNDTRPTTITGASRGKDIAQTKLNLLISAFEITKEASCACPQLQSVVGVLLTVLKTYKVCLVGLTASTTRLVINVYPQRYSDATGAIESLLSRMQPLNEILKKVRSNGDCPQALEERLMNLAW